jgi:hypothetical protein
MRVSAQRLFGRATERRAGLLAVVGQPHTVGIMDLGTAYHRIDNRLAGLLGSCRLSVLIQRRARKVHNRQAGPQSNPIPSIRRCACSAVTAMSRQAPLVHHRRSRDHHALSPPLPRPDPRDRFQSPAHRNGRDDADIDRDPMLAAPDPSRRRRGSRVHRDVARMTRVT